METAKNYFIKKVETQKSEERQIRKKIRNNAVFGAANLAAATYIMSTEIYPLGSAFLEYLGTICGFTNAASYFYEIKTTLDKKTESKNRNTQTLGCRSKTFTKKLQREIIF